VALVLLELSVTVTPAVGASPFKVTVPVALLPPPTELGAIVRLESAAGVIARPADFVVPLRVAEIVAFTVLDSPTVVTVNVALVAPEAIVTLEGTDAPLEAERLTVVPPVGAARDRLTVPVAELPPTTEMGETLTPARSGVRIVRLAFEVAPFNVPEIVAVTVLVTVVVVTVNVPEVEPAAITKEAGTVALVLLELSVTVTPPEGAGPFRLAVPVEEVPPVTVVGDTVIPVKAGGLIVKVADLAIEPWVPKIVTVVDLETPPVETVNVAVVAPPATVTVAGTMAMELEEAKATDVPPTGAEPVKVTVPVDDCPPVTAAGVSVRLAIVAGTMVRVADLVIVPCVAVTVAVVVDATTDVVAVKVAVVAPAATVTVAGTVALVLLELRLMTAPPVPAGTASVTVPTDETPPVTEAGDSAMLLSDGAITDRVPDAVLESRVAVIVAVVELETTVVVTENVATDWPPGTRIDVGTVTLAEFEARFIQRPLAGAGDPKVTVPVEGLPPYTDAGVSATL